MNSDSGRAKHVSGIWKSAPMIFGSLFQQHNSQRRLRVPQWRNLPTAILIRTAPRSGIPELHPQLAGLADP